LANEKEGIMEANCNAAAVIEEYIRPASFPVAVRITVQNQLPEGARRPLRDLGHPLRNKWASNCRKAG